MEEAGGDADTESDAETESETEPETEAEAEAETEAEAEAEAEVSDGADSQASSVSEVEHADASVGAGVWGIHVLGDEGSKGTAMLALLQCFLNI